MAVERTNIYQSVKFFYYYMKCSGMAFYSFDPNLLKFKCSPWHLGAFIAYLLLWISIGFFQLRAFKIYDSGVKFQTVNKLWNYMYFLQVFSIIPLSLISFIKRKHAWKVLELLHSYDNEVEKLKWKYQVKHSSKYIVIMLIIMPISMTFYSIYAVVKDDQELYAVIIVIRVIVYSLMFGNFYSVLLSFIMSCICICARFNAITNNLK
jgi:hypothetical protein